LAADPVTERGLHGVTWGSVVRRADERGSFRELWRDDTFAPLDPRATGSPPGAQPRFVQANLSTSAAGVLRGLHVHRRQLDHWIVASGRAFVALVDLRDALAGRGGETLAIETRSVGPDTTVTIPAGVAHGFLAIEPLELVYLVTNPHDDSDELGFAWDDPAVGVPWPQVVGTPDGRPILSIRDRANPALAELLARLAP
jgi:dTDP-4-dehydrorhamnose 3,5-epimerase